MHYTVKQLWYAYHYKPSSMEPCPALNKNQSALNSMFQHKYGLEVVAQINVKWQLTHFSNDLLYPQWVHFVRPQLLSITAITH